MKPLYCARCLSAFGIALSTSLASGADVITGYGVSANLDLFRFYVDSPGVGTVIGNLHTGINAMDFRPLAAGETDPVLYGISVSAPSSQLFIIDKTTAAVTLVGPGFPNQVPGSYSFTDSNRIGLDFIPNSLQPDGSMRIRLVTSNGINLQLNSMTGLVSQVNTMLAFVGAPGASPFVDGVAYTNNNHATNGGTSELFAIDSHTGHLYNQNPPNSGLLNDVGPSGVVTDALRQVEFDIYTSRDSMDSGIGGDRGFASFFAGIEYALFDINLATGQAVNGRAVASTPFPFSGIFAVIPEPVPWGCILSAGAILGVRRRRRQ